MWGMQASVCSDSQEKHDLQRGSVSLRNSSPLISRFVTADWARWQGRQAGRCSRAR